LEQIKYKPRGVCSREILITIGDDGDTVERVEFIGGCDGNAKGVASLCRGMKVGEVISRLNGINCGTKQTSCPNELAQALKKHITAK
jgi:uncharacterized protein TIGR03905